MKEIINKYLNHSKLLPFLGIAFVVLALVLIVGLFLLFRDVGIVKSNLASSTQATNQRLARLEFDLATTSKDLAQRLLDQQNQSQDFQSTISDITDTVGTLEKLSKTDKELLQKYSKVYFLSDNYVPLSLETIAKQYVKDVTKIYQFHFSALPFLEDMLNQADGDGVSLKIVSAYRSFGEQSSLKNDYLVSYGSGANQFSADQGYSEHQLGTAVDLTTDGLEPALAIKFETTPAFTWLSKNAYKYGFILSYPKGNVYYQYEPWHWRFVGVSLASRLHRKGITFSDMEQREIDTYLANIFD